MNVSMLLEMAADAAPERIAIGSGADGLTYAGLLAGAGNLAAWLHRRDAPRVGLLDRNSPVVPLLLFAAARLGRPFVPLNYRLADDQLAAVLGRLAPATLVASPDLLPRAPLPDGLVVATREEASKAAAVAPDAVPEAPFDADVALLLFTSGTTGEPKAAVLRHHHLVSYIISTVEFLGAGEDEAALISVPAYHIAGISAVLSSVYAGRRIVQLEAFDPTAWVATVRAEGITHAMVVPTMLRRILAVVAADGAGLPSLRHLSYGGGRMPVQVVEQAIELLPRVDLVNAYGLTETSSTIAVLGPDDHRRAAGSADGSVRRRLASVGRALPGVELQIRDPSGAALGPGDSGEIHVRGEQVSGEYLDGSRLDGDGWFATRDGGFLDGDGYLFVEGRLDDVIVRGGENLSPGEIEEVILLHPGVTEVAVVGLPDTEWGEQVVAAVVTGGDGAAPSEEEIRDWVRRRLRSSRTPSRVAFVSELPHNETGKLLRRELRRQLAVDPAEPSAHQ